MVGMWSQILEDKEITCRYIYNISIAVEQGEMDSLHPKIIIVVISG